VKARVLEKMHSVRSSVTRMNSIPTDIQRQHRRGYLEGKMWTCREQFCFFFKIRTRYSSYPTDRM